MGTNKNIVKSLKLQRTQRNEEAARKLLKNGDIEGGNPDPISIDSVQNNE